MHKDPYCNTALLESHFLRELKVSTGDLNKAHDIIHGRKIPAGNDGFWKPEPGDTNPYVQVR